MHYSKGVTTLLSTVFTFQFKTVVVADIVESSNEVLPGTDTAVNGLTSTPTSGPTSAKNKLKRKRNHSDVDVDTGILNPYDTAAAQGIDAVKTQKAKDQKTQSMNADLAHIRGNHETINNVFQLHHHLQKAKDVLVNAMSHGQDYEHHIGETKTKPEGFVAVVNNRPTKLVDRNEFSKQNFLARQ